VDVNEAERAGPPAGAAAAGPPRSDLRRRAATHGGVAVAVAAVFVAGWYAHAFTHRLRGGAERRVHGSGTRLVSPLLDVELPEGYDVRHEEIPFRYKVERYVRDQVRAGRVRDMSVYYRDLMDGPWFGVNEGRKYNPASMMKVPVMIAWLRRAERDPGVLQQSFVFELASYPGRPQSNPPEKTLAAGGRYTVDELLRYMLRYSDNRAMWLLYRALTAHELNDVLDSMDVMNDPGDEDNSISVHGYSGFFRVLFNASYLGREMSERALELLALQEFPKGMVAGVPKGVTVASKFGEWVPGARGEPLQLHEFGIVYHPAAGPYILGVMTVGDDWETQAAIIREVSALFYGELEAQARGWARAR
jgi:beta-lactamase class A